MSGTMNASLIRLESKCYVSCALFLPNCFPNFDFKGNNFVHKFQKYSFSKRYHAANVFALLF